jgi:NADH-quinone oxidoreductase subunit N
MESDLKQIIPQLVLLGAGLGIILGDAISPRGMPKGVVLALGAAGLLVAALAVIPLLGGARLVFGGSLAADGYAHYFWLLLLGATALVLFASGRLLDDLARYRAEFVGLLLLSTAALTMLAASNDLVTAYVSLEMSSLSIAFLSAWNKRDVRSTEAGLKFFLLSAMASAVLLYGMALIYGITGQLGFQAIAAELRSGAAPALVLAVVMLLAGFGFKVSAVPFHMWTPDVYEGAPTPVTAYLSVASKAAAFAVIARVLSSALPQVEATWALLAAVLALATMTVGNLAALVQSNMKRLLAYSSIAQAGYILVGLAAGSANGLSSVLFYLLAYAATNLGAFIAVIAISQRIGSEQIADYRGLHERAPVLAFCLAVSLFSLAGLPPFAGFFAKLYVFWAAVESGLVWLAIVGVVNSAISLYYYGQVVHDMYLLPDLRSGDGEVPIRGRVGIDPKLLGSLAVAVCGVFFLGILSGIVFALPEAAARTLIR